MKIAYKITLTCIVVSLILTSIAETIIYRISKNALQNAIFSNLIGVCSSRSYHIETYLGMLETSVGQLSKSVVLENLLKITGKNSPRQGEAFEAAMKRLAKTKKANPAIAEFLLIDKRGLVAASSTENSVGLDESTDPIFLSGQKGTFIKDVYFSEIHKEPLLAVSAPVLDSQTDKLLGVLAAKVRLNSLNDIAADRAGMGKTGEVYIINKDGYMITPSRFIEDAVLKFRPDTKNARQALLHKTREHVLVQDKPISVYTDYHDTLVLGTHVFIPQMEWSVLAEIDVMEAFWPLVKLRLLFLTILFTTIIAAWLIGLFLSMLIVGPIHRLHKGAEIIGSGNLDYKVGTDTKDEVGQLSRAFDKMTEDLKKTTTSVDILNKEVAVREMSFTAMREIEAKFSAIVEGSSDGIVFCESDTGNIISANAAMGRLLGYSDRELVSMKIQDLYRGEDWDHVRDQVKQHVTGQNANLPDIPVLKKDGNVLFADISFGKIRIKGKYYLTFFLRDITERKKAEDTIRVERNFIKSTINSLSFPFYVIDMEYKVILSNKAAKEKGVVEGGYCYQLTHKRQEPCGGEEKCPLKEVLRTNKPVIVEHIHCDSAGNKFIVEVHGEPIVDKDGRIVSMIEYTIDITEHKQREIERERMLKQQQDVDLLQQSLLAPAILESKLKTATDSIVRIFDADFCRIWLIRPGDLCEKGCMHAEIKEGPHVCRFRDKCLHLMASSGRYTHIDGKGHGRVPFGCYKIGRVASGEDHKFLTNDVVNDPRVHNREWARELGLVSFAGYQLKVPGGETIGVLALFAKRPLQPSEDAILDSLSATVTLITQLSIAIEALKGNT